MIERYRIPGCFLSHHHHSVSVVLIVKVKGKVEGKVKAGETKNMPETKQDVDKTGKGMVFHGKNKYRPQTCLYSCRDLYLKERRVCLIVKEH